MSPDNTPVTEAELHAYADGFLQPQERDRIDRWLQHNPDDATRVAEWTAQNDELRAMFAGYERALPGDAAMVKTPRDIERRSPWRILAMTAAATLIFIAGAATGRLVSLPSPSSPALQQVAQDLPGEAQSAFLIYASDVRHPVEVGADQEEHLGKWLGKRLDYPLSVPKLSGLGFQLVGGRLVPVNGKAGALFMYEDASGQRLTVLVGRNTDNRNTSFRFASAGTLETFYWMDGDIGYAVTGEISRERLRLVADECYRQFPT